MVAMSFQKRVSIALVIDDLRDQCASLADVEATLSAKREERDQTMCELKAAGIPERILIRITGLSLSSVKKITAGCRRNAAALDLETSLSITGY